MAHVGVEDSDADGHSSAEAIVGDRLVSLRSDLSGCKGAKVEMEVGLQSTLDLDAQFGVGEEALFLLSQQFLFKTRNSVTAILSSF